MKLYQVIGGKQHDFCIISLCFCVRAGNATKGAMSQDFLN